MLNETQAMVAKLRWAIDSGVTREAMRVATGIKSKSGVSEWLRTGRVAKQHIPVLAGLTETSERWWLTPDAPIPPTGPWLASLSGTVSAHEHGTDAARIVVTTAPADGYVRIEHLSPQPSMGAGGPVTEPVHLVRHLDVLERWMREEVGTIDAARIKVLTAVGRSMYPTIQHRDLVFVDVHQTHIDAPGIYVLDVDGRLLLKKALIQSDGTLILRSENQLEYPDEERIDLKRAADSIAICGKVMAWWTLRKG